jgi:thymidylate synthase
MCSNKDDFKLRLVVSGTNRNYYKTGGKHFNADFTYRLTEISYLINAIKSRLQNRKIMLQAFEKRFLMRQILVFYFDGEYSCHK